MNQTTRHDFLDWLRVMAIFVLIFFHTGMLFVGWGWHITNDETIPALAAEGSTPFVYRSKGKRVVMSFWRLPDRLLDDREDLANFARAALQAAHRAAAKKSPARRKIGKKKF